MDKNRSGKENPKNSKNRYFQIFDQVVSGIRFSGFDPTSKSLCRVYRSLERALGPVLSLNKIM